MIKNATALRLVCGLSFCGLDLLRLLISLLDRGFFRVILLVNTADRITHYHGYLHFFRQPVTPGRDGVRLRGRVPDRTNVSARPPVGF